MNTAIGTWRDSQTHFQQVLEHPWYDLLFSLFGDIYYATTSFYQAKGFKPALVPITTQSVSSPMGLGSDSLPVEISLFGSSTYLADSMQFQLEYMLRKATQGVFYVMPTFRGEDPDERHLNQFFHSEAEIRGGLDSVMLLVEEYLKALTQQLIETRMDEIRKVTGSNPVHLTQFVDRVGAITEVTYDDAVRILGNEPQYFTVMEDRTASISALGEARLIEEFGGVVWLTRPPLALAPFYQAYCTDGQHAKSADLLMGIGETVGCGERHADGKQTTQALEDHHIDPHIYDWYVQMKHAYPLQSAGFGMGVERFLLWVLGHHDVRDIPLFCRLKNHSSKI